MGQANRRRDAAREALATNPTPSILVNRDVRHAVHLRMIRNAAAVVVARTEGK